jgi:ABC-2 type transport system permease protein
MIRWRKVKAVANFEFLSTVKRPGYLIATFGMPVFLLAYAGVIGFFSGYAVHKKENELKVFGVVDNAQVLALSGDTSAPPPELPPAARELLKASGQGDAVGAALARGNAVFRPFEDDVEARAALDAKKVAGYYVIAKDYLDTGVVDSYLRESTAFDMRGAGEQLSELLVQRMLTGKVPDKIASLVKEPIRSGKKWTVSPEGEVRERNTGREVARFVVPIVFGMLMMVSLLGSAGYLMQAVATEKENKVIEVLLSSADPDEILAGKLLGLGGAGLIQVVVWFSMAAAGGTLTATLMAIAGIEIPWLAISLGFVYFILGYLLVGSLLLGTASLGSTMRESQQLSMVWTILTVIPLVLLNTMMAEPHGTLARILSYVPFTTALTMVMRLAIDGRNVAVWEIALTLILLAASIWFALKIGARLFRVGVLLSGARPKFGEILRQAGLTPGSSRPAPAVAAEQGPGAPQAPWKS